MSSLQVGDYSKLLDLIAQMLQHSGPGFPDTRVTGILRDAFQADFAGAGKVDLRGSDSYTWGDAPRPLAVGTGFHEYAVAHPMTRAYQRPAQPHPMRASDLPGVGALPPYGANDMSYLLVIPLSVTTHRICAVALMRRQSDFADRDVERACQLHPVLSAVYGLRRKFADTPPDSCDTSTGIPITPRELAVLDLMADGLIAAAIARRLGISPRTVSRHIDSVYRKLGVHDRTSAVLRAKAMGLPGFRS